jgi:D-3-phosphoglycerate dehydrogenase
MSHPVNIPSRTKSVGQVGISPTTTAFADRFKMRNDTLQPHEIRKPKVLHPVDNDDLRLLILENISPEAVAAFREQGFHVDHHKKAMSEDELLAVIGNYHAIGIRSKTKITEKVIKAASRVCSSLCLPGTTGLTSILAPRHRLLLHRHKSG